MGWNGAVEDVVPPRRRADCGDNDQTDQPPHADSPLSVRATLTVESHDHFEIRRKTQGHGRAHNALCSLPFVALRHSLWLNRYSRRPMTITLEGTEADVAPMRERDGLKYPFEHRPEPGKTVEVVRGVHWI